MNILLTGASGYLGGHVLNWLRTTEHNVITIGRGQMKTTDRHVHYQMDFANPEHKHVLKFIKDRYKIDLVWHFASLAQPYNGESSEYFRVNTIGSLYLAEVFHDIRFINVSTLLDLDTAYKVSKEAFDKVLTSQHKNAQTMYLGPIISKDKPYGIIHKVKNRELINVKLDPIDSYRSYVHIDDFIKACGHILDHKYSLWIANNPVSVKDIIQSIDSECNVTYILQIQTELQKLLNHSKNYWTICFKLSGWTCQKSSEEAVASSLDEDFLGTQQQHPIISHIYEGLGVPTKL